MYAKKDVNIQKIMYIRKNLCKKRCKYIKKHTMIVWEKMLMAIEKRIVKYKFRL